MVDTHKITRDIPLVITAFSLWKIFKRTQIVKLADIPLLEALERASQDVEPEKVLPLWRKMVGFLWD
jgi:amino acid transporter